MTECHSYVRGCPADGQMPLLKPTGPTMLTNPAALPTTLPIYVKDEIRRRIITGVYPPGHPLREQELEAQIDSSRGPIREGLRLLLLSGLVEHKPRRGFRVVSYSEKDLVDIYHLRAMLEGCAVEALTDVEPEKVAAALAESLQRMKAHFEAGEIAGYFEENLAFHKIIFESSGNKPLTRVLHYVDEVSLPARYKLLARDFSSARSLEYHERLIELIAARRFVEARDVTREHILANLEQLKMLYAQEHPDG